MTKNEIRFTTVSAVVFLIILEIGFRIYYSPPKRDYLTDLDPFTFFKLKPNLKNAILWGTEVNTNAQGFRYSKDISAKNNDAFRIFLLGGSTAFGIGASTEKNTLAVITEDILRKQTNCDVEFINAAVPGFTSGQEMGLFLNKLLDYSPDLIVIMDGFNDAYAPITSLTPAVPEPFIFLTEEYQRRDAFAHGVNIILSQSRMYLFFRSKMGLKRRHHFVIPEALQKPEHHIAVGLTYERNIRSIATVAKLYNIPVMLFLQPAPGACYKKLSPEEAKFYKFFWTERVEGGGEYFKSNHEQLRLALQRLNAEVLAYDMDAIFSQVETTIFTDEAHINDQGQGIIADYIAQKIIETGLIQTSQKSKVKS